MVTNSNIKELNKVNSQSLTNGRNNIHTWLGGVKTRQVQTIKKQGSSPNIDNTIELNKMDINTALILPTSSPEEQLGNIRNMQINKK